VSRDCPRPRWRGWVGADAAANLEKVTTAAIIANGAVFAWGMVDPGHGEIADQIEHAITALFVIEIGWRWRSSGYRLGYFKGWHLFDALVITLSLLPMLPGTAVVRLARLARLAKLLHLARHATQLRAVTRLRNATH
jgi:hypothetical protein